MLNPRKLLITGVLGLVSYYIWSQVNLAKNSAINIGGIKHLSISGGNISIQPVIEIVNPSDFGVTIQHLGIQVFTLNESTQRWVAAGNTSEPVNLKLKARGASTVAPAINIPIAGVAITALAHLASGKETFLPKVKIIISANIAGKQFSTTQIFDTADYYEQ